MTETNKYHPIVSSYIAAIDNIDGGVTVDDFATFEFVDTNYGGSKGSIIQNVLLHPKFKQLRKLIQKEVNEYCELVNPELNNLEWPIVSSWITQTPVGAAVGRHNHKHALYSGVYYPPGQEEREPLMLEFPSSGWNILEQGVQGTAFRSAPGVLFLFPAQLFHFTQTVVGDTPRYSLAFNVFFSGQLDAANAGIKVKASHI